MSYSCSDFADNVLEALEADGYEFHEGADDDTRDTGGIDGFYFTWAQPGRAVQVTGPDCDDANLAVLSALEHRLANSAIPLDAPADGVQATLIYPDALMHDLMTTAIESNAIGYWCKLTRRPTRTQREDKDLTLGHLSVTDFEADIIDGPVQCDHPDIAQAEIHRFSIDATAMRNGIERMLAPGAQVTLATRNAVLLMGADPEYNHHDYPDLADAVVQFAVFGELVFG